MCHLKRVSPSIVIVLAISLIFTPLMYAQEPAGSGSVAPVAAPPSTPAPEQLSLTDGWWKLPVVESSTYPGNDLSLHLDQAQSTSGGKTWTKGGKIMTGLGLAVAGIGVIMLAKGSSEDRIGDTDVAINWKATGAIWLAGGAVLALIGATRRH